MTVKYQLVSGSFNVNQIGFEFTGPKAQVGRLYMEFHGGRRYAHGGVTKKLFEDLSAADSVGGFYAKNVKGKHPVEWSGQRCNASPCQNDATLEAVVAGNRICVCDGCAKTQTQLALVKFEPLKIEPKRKP